MKKFALPLLFLNDEVKYADIILATSLVLVTCNENGFDNKLTGSKVLKMFEVLHQQNWYFKKPNVFKIIHVKKWAFVILYCNNIKDAGNLTLNIIGFR